MKEFIESKRILEVELPAYGKNYIGVCILDNDQVTILVNLNEDTTQFDGYSVFRCTDIYQYWDCSEIESNHDDLSVFTFNIDINECNSFENTIIQAAEKGLIAFFEKGDESGDYFVGELVSIKDKLCTFHLVDTNGAFLNIKKIELNSIAYFSYFTKYEIKLAKCNKVEKNSI